jgi:hypothetical protein
MSVLCNVQVMPFLSCAQVFNTVQSFHSDSAIAFALFLNNLPDLRARLQPAQLLAAIEASLGRHVLALSVHMQYCCCTMKH